MVATKTVYCPHEPKTRTFRRSRSSRLVCCEECYFLELRKTIVEALGEDVARRLDVIKKLDMSKAFPRR